MDGILHAQTKWASRMVFETEKVDTFHSCMDHAKLIAVKPRDSYLTSRLDKCINSLSDSPIFLTWDTNR